MLCPLNCRGIQVAVGWPAAPHQPGIGVEEEEGEGEELKREGGTIHVVANKEKRRVRVRMIECRGWDSGLPYHRESILRISSSCQPKSMHCRHDEQERYRVKFNSHNHS